MQSHTNMAKLNTSELEIAKDLLKAFEECEIVTLTRDDSRNIQSIMDHVRQHYTHGKVILLYNYNGEPVLPGPLIQRRRAVECYKYVVIGKSPPCTHIMERSTDRLLLMIDKKDSVTRFMINDDDEVGTVVSGATAE